MVRVYVNESDAGISFFAKAGGMSVAQTPSPHTRLHCLSARTFRQPSIKVFTARTGTRHWIVEADWSRGTLFGVGDQDLLVALGRTDLVLVAPVDIAVRSLPSSVDFQGRWENAARRAPQSAEYALSFLVPSGVRHVVKADRHLDGAGLGEVAFVGRRLEPVAQEFDLLLVRPGHGGRRISDQSGRILRGHSVGEGVGKVGIQPDSTTTLGKIYTSNSSSAFMHSRWHLSRTSSSERLRGIVTSMAKSSSSQLGIGTMRISL